jgi:hypothetical protein
MKKIITGKSSKNHDTFVCPALHIKFNIHVQNKTYSSLITKIKKVLDTLQEYEPKQYTLIFPEF